MLMLTFRRDRPRASQQARTEHERQKQKAAAAPPPDRTDAIDTAIEQLRELQTAWPIGYLVAVTFIGRLAAKAKGGTR